MELRTHEIYQGCIIREDGLWLKAKWTDGVWRRPPCQIRTHVTPTEPQRDVQIARLVMQLWGDPITHEGAYVGHRNGDSKDCALSNLYWKPKTVRHKPKKIRLDPNDDPSRDKSELVTRIRLLINTIQPRRSP